MTPLDIPRWSNSADGGWVRAWNVRLEEPAPPDSAARIAQMSTSALAVRLLDNIGDPRTLLVDGVFRKAGDV